MCELYVRWGERAPWHTCVRSWRKGCPGMCVIGGKAALVCVAGKKDTHLVCAVEKRVLRM